MALCVAVDFDGNDWAALYADPDDAVNIFGAAAVDVADMPRFTNGAGGSTTTADFPRYNDDRAKYGKSYITWTTGTVVTANVNIGYNAVATWTLAANVVPTGDYVAVFWAKRSTGNNNTFRMIVQRDSATTVATGSSQTISSSGWTKFTLSFSFTASVGDDKLYVMLQRTNGDGTTQNVHVTGPMIVAGTVAPDYFNCGTASIAEVITQYAMDARWSLGFTKAHQYVAPVGRADITLTNADESFSDYGPTLQSGGGGEPVLQFKTNDLVQIGDPDYGIWWTGWLESMDKELGLYLGKRATLKATDARRFLANKLPYVPLYTTETTSQIITDMIDDDMIDVPNTALGLEIGTETVTWDELNTGDIIQGYGDATPLDADLPSVLGDILGAVQGHFWFNRYGQARFTCAQGDASTGATGFTTQWERCGPLTSEMVVNFCEVIAHKRKVLTSGGPYTVWEWDSNELPFAIAGLSTEIFRAYFKDATTTNILAGATGLAAVETNSGAAGDITAALSEAAANSVKITFTNSNAASRNITAASITATTKVTQLREISKEASNATSITALGLRAERLNFNYVQMNSWAKRLANYRVARFGPDASYDVTPWVDLDATRWPDECFEAYIGAKVTIDDYWTGHGLHPNTPGDYAVIGEQHSATDGLSSHKAKYFLEAIYATAVQDTSP